MKETKKHVKKILKKITRKEFLYKFVIVVSTLALIATSILPYVL